MPYPISVRRVNAHREYRSMPHDDCHAYPLDRSQGCFCTQTPGHNGAHICSCANRWTD